MVTDSSPELQNKPQEKNTPLLTVERLTKHFPIRKGFWNKPVGAVQAVSDVSFEVFHGETLGLVGESGCGKSTLGRCILQLIRPTAGQVKLDGEELTTLSSNQLRPLRQKMQIVFQNPYSSLDPRMSIGDTLLEPLQIHKRYAESGRQSQIKRVSELLDRVGLPQNAISRFPHEFSGGQRQRIGIARALALDPALIIADEPVSALDVSIQAQVLNLLMDLQQELNLTLLFIAHNLSVVEFISQRVAVMYLGSIVEIAPREALYQQPLHPYTQALFSAVPVADPLQAKENKQHRTLLPGDLPNPANPPSGCRFHTRCPYVVEECKQEVQVLKEYTPGHFAACHRIPELTDLQTQTPLSS